MAKTNTIRGENKYLWNYFKKTNFLHQKGPYWVVTCNACELHRSDETKPLEIVGRMDAMRRHLKNCPYINSNSSEITSKLSYDESKEDGQKRKTPFASGFPSLDPPKRSRRGRNQSKYLWQYFTKTDVVHGRGPYWKVECNACKRHALANNVECIPIVGRMDRMHYHLRQCEHFEHKDLMLTQELPDPGLKTSDPTLSFMPSSTLTKQLNTVAAGSGKGRKNHLLWNHFIKTDIVHGHGPYYLVYCKHCEEHAKASGLESSKPIVGRTERIRQHFRSCPYLKDSVIENPEELLSDPKDEALEGPSETSLEPDRPDRNYFHQLLIDMTSLLNLTSSEWASSQVSRKLFAFLLEQTYEKAQLMLPMYQQFSPSMVEQRMNNLLEQNWVDLLAMLKQQGSNYLSIEYLQSSTKQVRIFLRLVNGRQQGLASKTRWLMHVSDHAQFRSEDELAITITRTMEESVFNSIASRLRGKDNAQELKVQVVGIVGNLPQQVTNILSPRFPQYMFRSCFSYDLQYLVDTLVFQDATFQSLVTQVLEISVCFFQVESWHLRLRQIVACAYRKDALETIQPWRWMSWESLHGTITSFLDIEHALRLFVEHYHEEILQVMSLDHPILLLGIDAFWDQLRKLEAVLRPLTEASYFFANAERASIADLVHIYGRIYRVFAFDKALQGEAGGENPYVKLLECMFQLEEQPLLLLAYALHPTYCESFALLTKDSKVGMVKKQTLANAATLYYKMWIKNEPKEGSLFWQTLEWLGVDQLEGESTNPLHVEALRKKEPEDCDEKYWTTVESLVPQLSELAQFLQHCPVHATTCEELMVENLRHQNMNLSVPEDGASPRMYETIRAILLQSEGPYPGTKKQLRLSTPSECVLKSKHDLKNALRRKSSGLSIPPDPQLQGLLLEVDKLGDGNASLGCKRLVMKWQQALTSSYIFQRDSNVPPLVLEIEDEEENPEERVPVLLPKVKDVEYQNGAAFRAEHPLPRREDGHLELLPSSAPRGFCTRKMTLRQLFPNDTLWLP